MWEQQLLFLSCAQRPSSGTQVPGKHSAKGLGFLKVISRKGDAKSVLRVQ